MFGSDHLWVLVLLSIGPMHRFHVLVSSHCPSFGCLLCGTTLDHDRGHGRGTHHGPRARGPERPKSVGSRPGDTSIYLFDASTRIRQSIDATKYKSYFQPLCGTFGSSQLPSIGTTLLVTEHRAVSISIHFSQQPAVQRSIRVSESISFDQTLRSSVASTIVVAEWLSDCHAIRATINRS